MTGKKLMKGDLTRKKILDDARAIFNEKSINLTLDNLASEMGITKGRITNHFSTKDKLFLAILADYEEKIDNLASTLGPHFRSSSLHDYFFALSRVMDLQYQYRCCIIYLNVLSPGQSELREHTYRQSQIRMASIRKRTEILIEGKMINKELLEKGNYDAFIFVYVNLLTQWVIHVDMYDMEKGYKEVKPLYMRAIFEHTYGPYLTAKAKKELLKIDFEQMSLV